ncbi:patatin-like phospholipase family protein [Nocardia arizonensis]|uniref:patatin-like phospholipase family protein n=1 Tax=Nocardia arizonensis TaxID=1141647 RepID=UPI0009EC6E55|nr:patatin family protein [Nocardia arizonensis]
MSSFPIESDVAEVIRERRDAGSRADGHRLALVIEGGGSRGVYAGGMVLALEELGLSSVFDAVYGTSAGALNGAWFLSGRAAPGMRTWTDPEIIRRTITPERVLRGRAAFNLRYLVHEVYESVTPMDFGAILANPTTFHPVATDIRTGLAVDLHPHIADRHTLQVALRASAGLPILAGPPVAFAGSRFFDGGLSESVPIRIAVRDGATHALILRTRRSDEHRPPASALHQIVGGGYLRLRAPGAYRSWLARAGQQEAEDLFTARMGTAALQIHPPLGSPDIDSASRDTDLLLAALEIGRMATHQALATAVRAA